MNSSDVGWFRPSVMTVKCRPRCPPTSEPVFDRARAPGGSLTGKEASERSRWHLVGDRRHPIQAVPATLRNRNPRRKLPSVSRSFLRNIQKVQKRKGLRLVPSLPVAECPGLTSLCPAGARANDHQCGQPAPVRSPVRPINERRRLNMCELCRHRTEDLRPVQLRRAGRAHVQGCSRLANAAQPAAVDSRA